MDLARISAVPVILLFFYVFIFDFFQKDVIRVGGSTALSSKKTTLAVLPWSQGRRVAWARGGSIPLTFKGRGWVLVCAST